MEIFQTFAEISIGILGFTAIVIMFRSNHSKWNNYMYRGMIGHSIMALISSILPFILEAYHCVPTTIWTACSIILGIITGTQGIAILIGDKDSKARVKIITFAFASMVAILQFLNVFSILSNRESGPYMIGITWHILQALVIFSMIVGKKIESESKD